MTTIDFANYEEKKTREKYFADFDRAQYKAMSPDQREDAYARYLMRYECLHRDNFSCQYVDPTLGYCPNCHNEYRHPFLTVHHIKALRNKGHHKPRNGVTLCQPIHARYEKKALALTFPVAEHLPPHIQGATFLREKTAKELQKPKWQRLKEQRRAAREIRKSALQNRDFVRARDLDARLIALLISFLTVPYYELKAHNMPLCV